MARRLKPLQRVALLSIAGLAWAIFAIWLIIKATTGRDPNLAVLIELAIAGAAFTPPALLVNRWFKRQNEQSSTESLKPFK
jgi:DMSO/TMAO reductase YedYZ heme-binding membrane subunit